MAFNLKNGIVFETRNGEAAGRELHLFVRRAKIDVTPVDYEQVETARAAYRRFGKDRRPARLNFGDCFPYTPAKATGEPALYQGTGFARTDVVAAANPIS